MKTCVLVILPLIPLLMGSSLSQAEEAEPSKAATQPALPPGMARADNPKQVAALYSEEHQKRVEAMHKEAPSERTSPEQTYTQKLIEYRTQLVEEQRQRKLKELELEREREARRRAEEEARLAQIERDREERVRRHQTIQIYHEWLQRRDRYLQHCHSQHLRPSCSKPDPAPCPDASAGAETLP